LNDHNRIEPEHLSGEPFQVHPKAFVFLDKQTGTPRFEVKAGPDGGLPIDQAVYLLAMHCLVRGQAPKDFEVMVSANEDLIGSLAPRARKLIHTCLASAAPVPLSSRQQEVLRGVLQNLTNKEIAVKLNLTERTVKFHMSSLLQKFEVGGRVSLMQKTAYLLSVEGASNQGALHATPGADARRAALVQSNLDLKPLRLVASERSGR
jgi:DNA-binding CsgD family transcriptional regulator